MVNSKITRRSVLACLSGSLMLPPSLAPTPNLQSLSALEVLVFATQGLVLVLNLESGALEHVGGSATDFLGCDPGTLREGGAVLLRSVIHPKGILPESQAAFLALPHRHGQGGARRIEFRVRRNDGCWRWFSATLTPFDANPEGDFSRLLILAEDVTVDRAALESVQEEQRQLHELTDLLPQTVFELDLDGTITYANQAMLLRFGYTSEDVAAGMGVLTLHVPEERERASGAIQGVLDGGKSGREYWGRRKDGTLFPMVVHASPIIRKGAPVGLRGLIVDLTEQKRVESALRESEQVYRSIFENTGNASVITDENGTICLANAEWERLSGYLRHECEEKLTWLDFVAPEDLERVRGYHQARCTPGEDAPKEYAFQFLTRSGEIRHVVNHVGLIPGSRKCIAFLLDVTDRRQAEAEREQLQGRLRQVEKLEAIGQLAGGIAHDFNNYLSTIQGFSELLSERLEDPSHRRYTDNIIASCGRAADLTKQLLAFARKGKIFSVPLDVHQSIQEVVGLLQHSLDRRIAILTHLEASVGVIVGDPTQLQNALMNMALNSRDAMPEGGTLTFATALRTLDEEYCRRIPYEMEPGCYLQISVTDTGLGMDAETQQRVFEPFFTTKELGKGTGLGMASVYGIVKNHRGAINVYSEIGRGTCIKIYLPLAHPGTEVQDAVRAAEPLRGVSQVLVVDDEEMVAEMATEMLEGLGYHVQVCRDGQEATEFYRHAWRDIDLVLLDLIMPRLGGKDTFVAMRTINPKARILLSSGFSLEGEAQRILDLGALGFLQKPYQKSELAQKIQQALSAV